MRRKPLKRKANLRAKTPNARKSGIRKVNRKRKAANHERVYGSKARWIRTHYCCVPGCLRMGIAAHTRTGGTGRKAGSETLVPLCPTFFADGVWYEGHHEESHRIGVKSFEKRHLISLPVLARWYEVKWQEERSRQDVPAWMDDTERNPQGDAPTQPEFSDV